MSQLLLNWPAIHALNIFINFNMIFHNEDLIKALFPEVFSSLGKLGKPRAIKLKPDTTSFFLKTSRWIPLPLKKAVWLELKSKKEQNVISHVKEPTDWYQQESTCLCGLY